MRRRWIEYDRHELAWIEAHRNWARRDAHAVFVYIFDRLDVSLTNYAALCKRKGWSTGRTGRFAKGAVPANKGKRMPFHPNSARTRFKAGGRSGRAAKRYQTIGTERVSKDGYLERKIHDGLPMQSRWRAVHLLRWEEANGAVPEGHALKCLDGDRTNTDPSNWEAVPRAMLPRLNGRFGRGYDAAPAELKPTLLAIAKLEHGARTARKDAEG